MQDETSQATISFIIRGGEISARSLRMVIGEFLQRLKGLEEKTGKSADHLTVKGKQSLRGMTEQGAKLTNLRISEDNIGQFDLVARQYDIDYSLKKDRSTDPPCFRVFFRARDWDVMQRAFEEYVRMEDRDRPDRRVSVKKELEKGKEIAREKNRGEKTRIPKYREVLR